MDSPQYDPAVEQQLTSWRAMLAQLDFDLAPMDELIRANQYDLRLNGVVSNHFARRRPTTRFALYTYLLKHGLKWDHSSHAGDSGLLTLPPELRENIYQYALTYEKPVAIHRREYKQSAALLQTCRQIRVEASPTFFKNNQFAAVVGRKDWRRLFQWAFELDASNATRIKLGIAFYDAGLTNQLCAATDLQDKALPSIIAKAYVEQEQLIGRILQKVPSSGLRLENITAPAIEMPRVEDGLGEYLLADIEDHWQKALERQVAALIAKAAE